MMLSSIIRVMFFRSSFREITRDGSGAVLTFRGPMARISVQTEECTFLKNTMLTNNNRAIRLFNGILYIRDSNFSGFTRSPPMEDHGGALYASMAEVTIVSSNFSNNVVAGIGYSGAAVYIIQGIMVLLLIATFISHNIAGGTGGAVHVEGGELIIDNSYFYL